jgi:hypothetical protein
MMNERNVRPQTTSCRTKMFLYSCIISALTLTCFAGAQTPLMNGGFESWTLFKGSGSFKDFEEPSDGWSSGNGVTHVAVNASPVAEKSTDAAQGMYSAKLTTRSIFGQIAAGSLFLGHFKLNLIDFAKSAVLGMPFTDRPAGFNGFYKYLPVKQDSATLYARLTRWTGSSQVVVGEAVVTEYDAVPNWTAFSIPFVYYSQATPDSLRIVLASSAGGENFRGEVGSVLFVDAVELNYSPMSVSDNAPNSTQVIMNVFHDVLEIQQGPGCSTLVRIINSVGDVVIESTNSHSPYFVDCSSLSSGFYMATVQGLNFPFCKTSTFTVCH